MTQPYHQLVPDFINDQYRVGGMRGSFQGAAMFVDLSGFSKMTDTLAQHSQHGAEVLAEMMRVVFEPMVNAVYAQGGFVVGYAGDAFNAVFPVEQDADQESGPAIMRCLSSAVAMQSHTKSHSQLSTPYGEFPIHIKVGIGYGETKWQIFKSADGSHATYWFRGESLNGAVAGEEKARAGDIVADPISFELIKDIVRAEPVDDCYLIHAVNVDLPAPRSIPAPKPADDLAGIFFPDSITRLSVVGEFRQVVNLFVDIPPGISDEALITPFMETVYLLQEQFGGFFLRPDLGDKGFNLLLIWGAPVAHENDVERALNFILELFSRTRLPLRAGLSYRMAYTGFIGAGQREDYTAYGWGVNLASRMMEHAGLGEYWMDAEVARRAEKRFHVKYLNEYKFKGFADKQKTFLLMGHKELAETVYQGHLVGRKSELESLASFIEPIRHGQFAGVMVLKGEAGIGKSRLLNSFQFSEYFSDFSARWVVCQADEILRLPFNPFKDWLKKRFELVDGQPDDVNLISFSRNIRALIEVVPDRELAAELLRTSSVLAALMNISQPDSLYESLDAKGRYDNTLIALSVLFRAESLVKPLILFMEDTHWLDGDTRAFLSYFVRSLQVEPEKSYPIAIIATQRPEGDSLHLMDEASVFEVNLEKLSSQSISSLAEDILGHPIADSLHKLLDARADGNPFFAEQILLFLSEQGALTFDMDGNYFADETVQISLPTDVRAVMVARLDRLAQRVRETVLTASVLGREFEVDILVEMLQHDMELPNYVHEAEKANIWSPLTEIEYIFRHALLRDAAYSMQLQVRQRELHGLALSAIEVVYRDDLEPHYGELAYHAEKAGLNEKALHYLTLAGNHAMSVFQNHQAVDYYTRALSFIPQDGLRIKFDVLLKRVECNFQIGNPAAQIQDLELLEKIVQELDETGLFAQVYNRHAYLAARQGDYKKVVEFGFKAKELAEQIGDHAILSEVSRVVPNALAHLGKLHDAMKIAQEGLDFARKQRNRIAEARSLTTLGLIALEVEGPSVAYQYQKAALEISKKEKDRFLEAAIMDNIANAVGLSQGDFQAAHDYFEQEMLIYSEYGNLSGKGHVMANLGWIASILGDYPAATNYYEQALVISRQLGNRMETMFTYVNLSSTASAQNLVDEALEWAHIALDLSVKMEDPIGEAWACYSLGLAELKGRQFDKAVNSFSRSIEIRSTLNAIPLINESRAGLVNAYWGLNDQISAEKEAEQIIQHMEKDTFFEGAEEPLRIYFAIFDHLNKIKDPRARLVLQNANQLLNAQVSKLRSDEARRMFVENVPWRRAIAQAVNEYGL